MVISHATVVVRAIDACIGNIIDDIASAGRTNGSAPRQAAASSRGSVPCSPTRSCPGARSRCTARRAGRDESASHPHGPSLILAIRTEGRGPAVPEGNFSTVPFGRMSMCRPPLAAMVCLPSGWTVTCPDGKGFRLIPCIAGSVPVQVLDALPGLRGRQRLLLLLLDLRLCWRARGWVSPVRRCGWLGLWLGWLALGL